MAKKFDVVVVWKLDRFARNRFDSAHYKSALRKNGVKVISATESIFEGVEVSFLSQCLRVWLNTILPSLPPSEVSVWVQTPVTRTK